MMFQGPAKRLYSTNMSSTPAVWKQNGRFTLFSSKFHSNIYSILFAINLVKTIFIFCKYDLHNSIKDDKKQQ